MPRLRRGDEDNNTGDFSEDPHLVQAQPERHGDDRQDDGERPGAVLNKSNVVAQDMAEPLEPVGVVYRVQIVVELDGDNRGVSADKRHQWFQRDRPLIGSGYKPLEGVIGQRQKPGENRHKNDVHPPPLAQAGKSRHEFPEKDEEPRLLAIGDVCDDADPEQEPWFDPGASAIALRQQEIQG